MKKVVLDTSIIIDHVRGRNESLIKLLKLQEEKKVKLVVPAVVIFEFYSGLSLRKRNVFKKSELLFSKFKLMAVDEEIAKLAARINRKQKLYQKIGAVDLLIGATALSYSAFLATKNTKDFRLIPKLKFWEG